MVTDCNLQLWDYNCYSNPNRLSVWFTLSSRMGCLPCSNSRTKRKTTPYFSDRSICVKLYCLYIAFTYLDSVVCSIASFYTLSKIKVMKCFILHLFGYKNKEAYANIFKFKGF
jgi:hypothetical protein